MKIDRKEFLLFTAAITAATTGGCGPKVTAELPPPKPASSTMLARPAQPPPDTDAAYDPLGAPPPGSTAEGAMAPGATAEAGYGGIYDGGSAIDEQGYAIAEMTANPRPRAFAPDPRCAALRAPGATCESFGSTVDLCNGVVQHLDKPLGDAVVNCLSQKSNTQKICTWEATSSCLDQSAARTRPGAADTAACVQAAQKCSNTPSFNRRSCVSALSHAKPSRHARLASCISEFCEVGTCVFELSP